MRRVALLLVLVLLLVFPGAVVAAEPEGCSGRCCPGEICRPPGGCGGLEGDLPPADLLVEKGS